MAERYQLEDWKIEAAAEGGFIILTKGSDHFATIIKRAFRSCTFSKAFESPRRGFDWGLYVQNLTDEDRLNLEIFLQTLKQGPVYLFDDFEECFALGSHWKGSVFSYRRTELGELLLRAKYRNDTGAIAGLVKRLAGFCRCAPMYKRTDLVVPVPPNQSKQFDVPTELAKGLAHELGVELGTEVVRKVRITYSQKDVHTEQAKVQNVKGAFELAGDVGGKSVLVLDDLYQSGHTINEVGRTIRAGRPTQILGLVVTKTHRDV